MVAGIIVAAAGDKLTITHPHGQADAAAIATVLDGPALFLAGQVLFKRALLGELSVARLVAIAALVALVPLGWVVSSLGLATMATLVLTAVAGGTRESSTRACPANSGRSAWLSGQIDMPGCSSSQDSR